VTKIEYRKKRNELLRKIRSKKTTEELRAANRIYKKTQREKQRLKQQQQHEPSNQ